MAALALSDIRQHCGRGSPALKIKAAEQAVDPLATLILGSVPPALAILAELKSPVSSAVVQAQSFDNSEQFVPMAITDTAVRDSQKNAIAEVMTGTAIGAAEASGLVPTWISFITGLTAVFIDIVDPKYWLGIVTLVAVITAISAIYGISFFAQLNYYAFDKQASRRRICRRRTGTKCASCIMIIANLIIIFVVAAFWLLTDPTAGAAALRYVRHLLP
jgi:hypothetical protein